MGEEDLRTFYYLTHKKHGREIYFKNNYEAIKFLEPKFNSFKKKGVYLLLQFGILQPFLSKIKLPKEFGDVILVAEKINCFNLNKKEVLSFQRDKNLSKEFIRSKKFQKKMASKGFAPKVYEINEKIPYSKEELLEVFNRGSRYEIFKKINKLYRNNGINKIPIKKYTSKIMKELKKRGINDVFLRDKLNEFSKKKMNLLVTFLHGDFAMENILVRKKQEKREIVFTDYHPYNGLITNSLVNYFYITEDIQSSKYFKQVIGAFPKEVQKNIKIYLILSEIDLVANKGKSLLVAVRRIKKHLSH
ncbi:MAG: hypothetical protein WDZ77_00725 [Candidatus Pacearchaeota archaeon]